VEASETRAAAVQLREASDAISELTASITSISSQTHLLALNATIEAQRAGESGRGFAVVASEVKLLATKTAETTEHVTQHVAQVHAVSEALTRRIERIAERLSVADAVSETTGSATRDSRVASRAILEDIGRIKEGAAGIANAAASIGETSGEIARGSDSLGATASEVENAVASLDTAFQSLMTEILEGQDRRAFPRFPFVGVCTVEHDGRSYSARLVNISIDGFMIEGLPTEPRIGDLCILRFDAIRSPLSAEVRWRSPEGINCQFTAEACEDDDLNEIVDRLEGSHDLDFQLAQAA